MSRLQRVESLFEQCLELPPAERAALLEARRADDPALVAEVLALLELDASPDPPRLPGGLDRTDAASEARAAVSEVVDALGPYRLGERIGEGGFGEVFVAEQTAPIRRRVAVKILKAGMDTRAVLSRFEAERQALALMDHPNVARVLDAGETPSGRPYFVMEFVDGEAITTYCDRHALPLNDRLNLFVTACRGVEHAHQKGIIHRDLKPSNILVTTTDGKPQARVIDFGIAKATGPSSAAVDAPETRTGELLGTPGYMSPEQVASGGVDIDTRSDVYALGVVLYRLLTGRTPFDAARLRGAGVAALRRILEDEEPPRPSDSLQGQGDAAAPGGAADATTTARMLRGDLDWIVLRAMARERERRYPSALALSEDIERHLRNEPVEAGPATTAYRLRKFVHRRRGAIAAAALVVAALFAGIAGTSVQALRARRAEAEARREARAAAAVNTFLTSMVAAANPEESPLGLTVTVREVITQAAAELERTGLPDPETEIGIRRALGSTYFGLGLYADAERHFLRGIALAESSARRPGDVAELELLCAESVVRQGRYAEAQQRLERLDARIPANDRELRTRLLQALGGNLGNLSRFAEADSLLGAVVEIRRGDVALDPAGRARLTLALSQLAELRARRGDLQTAIPLSREALSAARATHRGPHHDVARVAGSLAGLLRRAGGFAEAESLYRESLAIDRHVLGMGHPIVAQTMNNLGILLEERGRYSEAEAVERESLRILEASLGPDHPDLSVAMSSLATALQSAGRLDEALPLRIRSLELSRSAAGPRDENVATSLNNLASLYRLLRRFDDAVPLFEEAHGIFVALHGAEHPSALIAANNIGKTCYDAGRYEEAERRLGAAAEMAARSFPSNHPNRFVFDLNHGRALLALGRRDEAEPKLLAAYAGLERSVGPAHVRCLEAATALAALCRETGRRNEAAQWSERAERRAP